ncbi:MAG: hypothetical protein IPP13_18815 [Kouleothrix sp.]|jgi:hypothetical protein|nr:hypothetical protein [Kouleothrix sp.]
MAFINRPTAQLTFVLVDGTGSRATMSFDVPYDTLAAVAIAAADVLRPLINALTGCVVVSQSLTYSSVDNTPAAPAADSRVERKGVVQFLTAVGKTVSYSIPGIWPTMLNRSGSINEDMPAMQAFVNGVIAIDAIFSDSNGVNITAYKSGYERFRRSTRAMLPSDRRPDPDILP